MKTRLFVIALSTALIGPAAFAGESHPHWGYEGESGPAHWADLDENFKTCRLGKLQSPINIETARAEKADLVPIDFAYAASAAEVVNNGHTIQINLPDAGGARIEGAEYRLLQFHFHTPSEEKIDGENYPLVAHFVHKDSDGHLAVVAVLFKLGEENTALRPIFAELPKEGEARKVASAIDAGDLLPTDRTYYAFAGSLTTPPCSENVRWQVLKTPIEISEAQLAAFKALYPMNARPVQPLNGRVVRISR
jgi:carbonic anhydrase